MKTLVVQVALVLALPGTSLAQAPRTESHRQETPVDVEAETERYDSVRHRAYLSGGVVLRRGAVTLRARSASYDAETGEIEAIGDVLLSEPGRLVAADSMHLVLDGPFEAREVTAFYKDRPLQLSGVESVGAARAQGRNRLTVTGTKVSGQEGENRLSIEGARLTLCDCGSASPSWSVHARHADVIPGKRAILSWPVFYITPRFLFVNHEVPVFVLPWIYLPLAERQTGLLFPMIDTAPTARLVLAQPVFFDLGRSYDATLTPQYFFGIPDSELRAHSNSRGIAGPGANLEVRWAPAEGTLGRLQLRYLHDVAHTYQSIPGGLAQSPEHGDRLGLTLLHDQRISDRTHFHAEAGLVTDPLLVSDFTPDVLLRNQEYGRSSLALTHRTGDLLLEADADYHSQFTYLGQQSFPIDPGNGFARFGYGTFGSNVPQFHRLPSASAMLLPVRLAGPLFLSGSAGVARFAPLKGVTGDEGSDGIGPGDRLWPGPGIAVPPKTQFNPDPGELDGRWQPGERLAAIRETARAELRAPFTIGNLLTAEPWVRGTLAGYEFESTAPAMANAWGTAGLTLSTELSRVYGSGASRVRHVIEPRIEWRAGTHAFGPELPAYAYDELDAAGTAGLPPDPVNHLPLRPLSALPGRGFNQLRLALRNRLTAPSGPFSRGILDLEFGQDLDLGERRVSETYARAGFGIGPVSGNALARCRLFGLGPPEGTPPPPFPSPLDRFSELRANLTLSDPHGDNLHGGIVALASGASGVLRSGLEPLFDPRPIDPRNPGELLPVAQASAGVTFKWSGLTASYDLLFTARRDASGPTRIQQHSIGLIWDSPCHCWKVGLGWQYVPRDPLHFPTLTVDLSSAFAGSSFPQ